MGTSPHKRRLPPHHSNRRQLRPWNSSNADKYIQIRRLRTLSDLLRPPQKMAQSLLLHRRSQIIHNFRRYFSQFPEWNPCLQTQSWQIHQSIKSSRMRTLRHHLSLGQRISHGQLCWRSWPWLYSLISNWSLSLPFPPENSSIFTESSKDAFTIAAQPVEINTQPTPSKVTSAVQISTEMQLDAIQEILTAETGILSQDSASLATIYHLHPMESVESSVLSQQILPAPQEPTTTKELASQTIALE